MTTEIEKQFFDTFGIEPIKRRTCSNAGDCPDEYNIVRDTCDYWRIIREDYPEITDRILLELICIINQIDLYFYGEYDYFTAFSYKGLKEEVISKCKRLVDKNAFSEITGEHIKNRVRTLFEEDTNNDR